MGAAARKRRAAVVCEISRRRRAAGFVAAQSAAAAAAATARRERVARENRVRLDWEQRMRTLSPKEFRLTYRMDSEAFGILLERVRPAITTANPTQARRSSGSEVSAVCRLSMTLRWLAGGCVHDIYQMHGVAYNTFYNSLWKTVDAINNHSLHKFKFDCDDHDALYEIERGFAALSTNQCFRGCVGAMDGLIVKIKAPSLKDDSHPMRFFVYRKHCYGLNVQAMSDAEYRFTWAQIDTSGTSSDYLALFITKLFKDLVARKLPADLHIIGDDAYCCEDWFLTPCTDTHYNFYLSQLRITIEQSFGILVRRWGVLWRPMECKFNKTPHVVMCCMRLHNFCIDNNVNLVWRRPPTRQPGHAAQMAAHQPIIDR